MRLCAFYEPARLVAAHEWRYGCGVAGEPRTLGDGHEPGNQRTAPVKIIQLRHFVVVAQELHFPRAAERLGISLQALYSSIEKLEEEVGHPVVTRGANSQLTRAGALLLDEAQARLAAEPEPMAQQKASAGGKAKANKGKGRAPAVKGQPKPYKKRQGR